MRRSDVLRSAAPVAAAVTALLLTAACGDAKPTSDSAKGDSDKDSTASPDPSASVDTSAAAGAWLLGLQSAGGNDGEKSTTVYITYDPSTGQAKARSMPGVTAASASSEVAPLLVSADRMWAIPDTSVPDHETQTGKLTVYSVNSNATKVVDIRKASGDNGLRPVGWAFDPERADTLRVVDTANRVWVVNVSGGKATKESTLPKGGPWEFLDDFNRNTGEPYLESIDSDATKPAGNGAADTSPVTRDDGTVLADDSDALAKLPASPCRLGAAFVDANGVTWTFCADKPTLSTYYLPKDGTTWTAYGKPSGPVAPEAAAFPLVLPPAQ